MSPARILVYIAVGAALFLAVACGVGDDGDGDGTGALYVALTEWTIAGEDGAALPTARAGEVSFEVHNEGAIIHDFAVFRTDTDPADLPVAGVIVDEEAAGELLGRISSNFGAGAVEVLTLELTPGAYALVCNTPGHYQVGMFAKLVVE